ncbi:hypothetical protein BD410DRAFT_843206 [Rickenella mellea]|uniref:Uncharacterized protein n=1 Tax=Rickenella mellea TaxID=50990 RepID=A0A4Y7PT90_9AGAM|nr:hypothetical protein BD410DRAFT_843206 [Rickenella mellea]
MIKTKRKATHTDPYGAGQRSGTHAKDDAKRPKPKRPKITAGTVDPADTKAPVPGTANQPANPPVSQEASNSGGKENSTANSNNMLNIQSPADIPSNFHFNQLTHPYVHASHLPPLPTISTSAIQQSLAMLHQAAGPANLLAARQPFANIQNNDPIARTQRPVFASILDTALEPTLFIHSSRDLAYHLRTTP